MTSSRVDALLKKIDQLNVDERRELIARLQADQLTLPLVPSAESFQANTLIGQPDYIILFDGGSIGNPGKGYGSYALKNNLAKVGFEHSTKTQKPSQGSAQGWQITRLNFGDNTTNNEAEYATLMQALDDLHSRIERADRLPQEFSIEIRGDSLLVINQVSGEWKSKDDRMRSLRDAVRKQIGRFKANRLVQHPREESVRVLGH
jgi:ribonuclease HI